MSIIRKLAAAVVVILLAVSSTGAVMAQTKIDPEVAKTLTLKAAALVKEQGVDALRPIFQTSPDWKYADIYVSVIDYKGVWLVYPVRPAGEGKSVFEVKDPDGRLIVQEIIKVAQDKGEGWVEYRWLNPVSSKIEPKATYVKNVPERNVVVYVGVYK